MEDTLINGTPAPEAVQPISAPDIDRIHAELGLVDTAAPAQPDGVAPIGPQVTADAVSTVDAAVRDAANDAVPDPADFRAGSEAATPVDVETSDTEAPNPVLAEAIDEVKHGLNGSGAEVSATTETEAEPANDARKTYDEAFKAFDEADSRDDDFIEKMIAANQALLNLGAKRMAGSGEAPAKEATVQGVTINAPTASELVTNTAPTNEVPSIDEGAGLRQVETSQGVPAADAAPVAPQPDLVGRNGALGEQTAEPASAPVAAETVDDAQTAAA